MDDRRKKQLLLKYKYIKPEMGIIYLKCSTTDDIFIDNAKDTKASINRNVFQLGSNLHPNSILQKLWNNYGKNNFEIGVLEVLPYDEGEKDKNDYTKELESLYERKLRSTPNARRIK